MASIYDKASLVMIPSGTKTSKIFSQKPVSGDGDFTFSRSTAATRVNEGGAIEKETQNLLLQSNTFDTTWRTANSSVTSGQTGYDGTSNAWLLNGSGAFARLIGDVSVSGVFTISIHAKANTTNYLDINMLFNGVGKNVIFDLVNGVKTDEDTPPVASKMTNVGNDWWRIELTLNGTLGSLSIGMSTDGTIGGFINFTSGSFYIQDAQLEQGLVARDVITTTTSAVEGGITDNVPRLDYTDSSCPALLLEPQRTNINPYSEYFGTFWNGLGNETITSNYGISPEGLSNATRFQATSAGRGGMYASIAVNNGTTYTLSFYAKSLSGTQKLRVGADNGCVNPQGAETFEVTTEWQKFTKTITSTQGGWNIFFDNVESGSGCTGTYLNCDMLVYGYQVEAGSYATSYIPTYGTSVTRNQDNSIIADTGDIIADAKGSFFIDINVDFLDTNGLIPITAGSGTAALYYLWLQTGRVIRSEWYNGGGLQSAIATSGGYFDIGDRLKIAAAYQNNDFVMYVNGTLIGTDTSGNAPSPTSLRIGQYNASTYSGGAINEFIAFPTRLSNEELATLTTI